MRKTFSGVIGVLFLAVTGLPTTARAQGHGDVKDVNVVNTPSVTVANTPSVNVANTPAVTVSNSPTVTVGNTPSVNVANTPAVTISNTTAQPVLGSSIDQPGRIAYQSQVSISNGSCSGNGTCFFEFSSVPAGHRVVIQHVSGVISFSTTASAIWSLCRSLNKLHYPETKTMPRTSPSSTENADQTSMKTAVQLALF